MSEIAVDVVQIVLSIITIVLIVEMKRQNKK